MEVLQVIAGRGFQPDTLITGALKMEPRVFGTLLTTDVEFLQGLLSVLRSKCQEDIKKLDETKKVHSGFREGEFDTRAMDALEKTYFEQLAQIQRIREDLGGMVSY